MFCLPVCCVGFLSGLAGLVYIQNIHTYVMSTQLCSFLSISSSKKKGKKILFVFFREFYMPTYSHSLLLRIQPSYHFNSLFLLNVFKGISKKICFFVSKTKIKIQSVFQKLNFEIILQRRIFLVMALMNLQICQVTKLFKDVFYLLRGPCLIAHSV